MHIVSSTLVTLEQSESFDLFTKTMTAMLNYTRKQLVSICTPEEMESIMLGCT
jgi:hypothetical protein